jgi:hypothetical protein
MGDRSYAAFRVRNRDLEEALHLLPVPDRTEAGANSTLIEFDELVGGGFDHACNLRDEGIPFKLTHGDCLGQWESGIVAYNGESLVEIDTAESGAPRMTLEIFHLTEAKVQEFRSMLAHLRAVEEMLDA